MTGRARELLAELVDVAHAARALPHVIAKQGELELRVLALEGRADAWPTTSPTSRLRAPTSSRWSASSTSGRAAPTRRCRMPDREALIRAVDRRFESADWGLGRDVATAAVTVVLRDLGPDLERLELAAQVFFGALNAGAIADSADLEEAITAVVAIRKGPAASGDDS